MNVIQTLSDKAKKRVPQGILSPDKWIEKYNEEFAKLLVEETLVQVDERCYGRGENQWYYDDDKRWVRLHFGYGELNDAKISGTK